MNPGQNRDNLRLLAACATEDARLLLLTLSALWSHDTTVYSYTPTASAPQVSWTVVGGVIQRRAGAIAPLIRLSCTEQTSVSNTGEQGCCYWSCKRGFSAHSCRTHWNTPSVLLVEEHIQNTNKTCIPRGLSKISSIRTNLSQSLHATLS